MRASLWDAAGIVAGVVADRLWADPQQHHPVALFGSAADTLRRRMWADSVARGAAFEAVAVGIPVVITRSLAGRRGTARHAVVLAAATWIALGGTSLARTGTSMAQALRRSPEKARQWVPWLCSRDPQALDEAGMARATVESLAENTSDAVTGTLVWAVLAGAPGVVAHRCMNTLDAMVGYKNERYLRFGRVPALADDAVNWLPARVTALVHCAIAASRDVADMATGQAATLRGHNVQGELTARGTNVSDTPAGQGDAGEQEPVAPNPELNRLFPRLRRALRAWKHDAPNHPSPNAGRVEATAAAVLGVQLGGRTEYSYGVEMRPVMGEGPAPTVETIDSAVALCHEVTVVTATLAVGAVLLLGRRHSTH